MSGFENLEKTKLSADDRMAVERFCWEAREALGEKLLSITLYGSAARGDYAPGGSDINILVLTASLDLTALQGLLDPVSRGLRAGIHPLLMTETDLKSSADIYPVKYLSMKESYLPLWGEDPLAGLTVAREHIRLRCEQEMMNQLLRLRRHYVYHGGWGLADKIASGVTGFLENLRYALSLDRETPMTREEAIAAAEKYGVPPEALRGAWALKTDPEGAREIERVYEEYLKAVERAVRMIDSMGG
jgi:predicted nucleotidyltransferase